MKPRSAKAKGRRFQQEVRDAFLDRVTQLEPDDIRSNPMGAPGEDLLLSPAARKFFPYAVECKNVEKLNIWEAIKQARAHSDKYPPLVAFKRNTEEPFIAIPMNIFLELINVED